MKQTKNTLSQFLGALMVGAVACLTGCVLETSAPTEAQQTSEALTTEGTPGPGLGKGPTPGNPAPNAAGSTEEQPGGNVQLNPRDGTRFDARESVFGNPEPQPWAEPVRDRMRERSR